MTCSVTGHTTQLGLELLDRVDLGVPVSLGLSVLVSSDVLALGGRDVGGLDSRTVLAGLKVGATNSSASTPAIPETRGDLLSADY